MDTSMRNSQFLVRGTVHVPRLDRFVVYGDILEGEVRNGMRILLPEHLKPHPKTRVLALEYIDGTSTGSHVALSVQLDDQDDLRRWKELQLNDLVLEIAPPLDP